jgi:phage terminase large subunit GpA-like protein
MNVLNLLGSIPTGTTMGVILCVVIYAIGIGISSMVAWHSLNHRTGEKKEESLKLC